MIAFIARLYDNEDVTEHLDKPKCYVASPLGFAESTHDWYNDKLLPMLGKYVTVLDPWVEKVDHIFEAPAAVRVALWTDLGDKHYDNIRDNAKLLVAVLDQEPPDNGTICEVAWAAAHRIPVIGYRGDVRTTGEENMPYNLMIAAAIRRSGGTAVASLAALEPVVAEYAKRVS